MKLLNHLYGKQPDPYLPKFIKESASTTSKKTPITDTFTKSVEIPTDLETLESQLEEKNAELEALNQIEMMESELAASKSELDSVMRMFDILLKCLKIAARIIDGDQVPKQDEHLLMENYPDIYSSAKILSKQNNESKKHKSLADKVADPSEPTIPTDHSELRSQLTTSISEIEAAITEHSE